MAREQRSMDPRTFAVELLGVGDWPAATDCDARTIAAAGNNRRCGGAGMMILVNQ